LREKNYGAGVDRTVNKHWCI